MSGRGRASAGQSPTFLPRTRAASRAVSASRSTCSFVLFSCESSLRFLSVPASKALGDKNGEEGGGRGGHEVFLGQEAKRRG